MGSMHGRLQIIKVVSKLRRKAYKIQKEKVIRSVLGGLNLGALMPPKVITITNQKGGTGKTTLTALLAYGLALQDRRVLLLDLDPQSHLSSLFLKINDIENVTNGVLELAAGGRFEIRKIKVHIAPNRVKEIGLVPSGINYILNVYRGQIPAWDPNAVYKRIMREPAIMRNYDYIICDTPPELFPPTIWGLYAADYLIIPTNLEELSLAGVKILFKEIIPDVILNSKKELKVLGTAIVNVTRKYKMETIKALEDKFVKFIKHLPSSIYNRIYRNPFFETIILRHSELKDLSYRPRRWEIPLSRIIEASSELRDEVLRFGKEVENRIERFEGLL
jgi:chromosome partitioning protein